MAKTHLRINDNSHKGGGHPTFYVTACGIKHWPSGIRCGYDRTSNIESVREDLWKPVNDKCKFCAKKWRP